MWSVHKKLKLNAFKMWTLHALLLTLAPSLSFAYCGDFPVANSTDRVLSFLPDLDGVYRDTTANPANSKTEGSLVYNSTTGELKLCDGIDWVTIESSGATMFGWGTNSTGQLGIGGGTAPSIPKDTRVPNPLTGEWGSQDWKQVSAGDYHTCAIASDDKIYCWGSNWGGQLGNGNDNDSSAPVPLTSQDGWNNRTWKQVDAGSFHTCAISFEDKIYCWGGNWDGQLGNGSDEDSLSPVSLDSNGGWSEAAWKQVVAGYDYTCAISSDDKIYCWGSNWSGKLANGTEEQSSSSPTSLDPVGGWDKMTWKQLGLGYDHTCAISSEDKIYCWGYGKNGQLGNASYEEYNATPTPLDSTGGWNLKNWKTVNAGGDHTCAIDLDNKIYCWGGNWDGQLGNGSYDDTSVPMALDSNGGWNEVTWKQVTAEGWEHTCAIASDDKTYCWGSNENDQLGIGNENQRSPVPVSLSSNGGWNNSPWLQLSLGEEHTCGLSTNNKIYCWGESDDGQLGIGDENSNGQSVFIPTPLSSNDNWNTKTWKQVDAGFADPAEDLDPGLSSEYIYAHTCGISSDDKIYCWGNNYYGQLGRESDDEFSPLPIALDPNGNWNTKTWKQVSAGGIHTCAISADDKIYCWGGGSNGQLGDGEDQEYNAIPRSLTTTSGWNDRTWKQVSGGLEHTCAIATDDRIYCWGSNEFGQLGNESVEDFSSVPIALSSDGGWDIKTWKQVSAGHMHTCAIATDDKVYCWGIAWLLGNGIEPEMTEGGPPSSPIPTPLSATDGWDIKTWKQVSAGGMHTCGIGNDDRIYCWGAKGLLGNDSAFDMSGPSGISLVPSSLAATGGWNSKIWKQVSAGSWHTCAIASDNIVHCWGLGMYGQLGVNTLNSWVPLSLNKKWSEVSAGTAHTMALGIANPPCDVFSTSEIDSNDLVMNLVTTVGSLRVGDSAKFTSPHKGLMAYSKLTKTMMVCDGTVWKKAATISGDSCSGYPNTSRTIEWLADGTNLTRNSTTAKRTSPREGSLVYNSTTKRLQVCDGTTWQVLSVVTPPKMVSFEASLPAPNDFTTELTVTGLDFDYTGTPQSVPQTITIKNTGNILAPYVYTHITSGFEISASTCYAWQPLAIGGTCTIEITPVASGRFRNGLYTGTLSVAVNNIFMNISLEGTNTLGTCDQENPPLGLECDSGVIYLGSLPTSINPNSDKYMMMPSGCDGTTTDPSCSGTGDTAAVTMPWNDGTSVWGLSGVESFTQYDQKSTDLGDINTSILAAATAPGGGAYKAAKYCSDMVFGGYDDWYLPSKSELAYIYCKAVPLQYHESYSPNEEPNCSGYGGKEDVLSGFDQYRYWSSTERNITYAWVNNFAYGYQDYYGKSSYLGVRCIRRSGPSFQASLASPESFTSNLTVTGLDFDYTGTPQSLPQTILIKNTGDEDANDLSLATDDGFEIESTTCTAALNINQTCEVTIKASFAGRTTNGVYEGQLTATAAGRSSYVGLNGLSSNIPDPCSSPNPPSGTVCGNGAIWLEDLSSVVGGYSGIKYMIAPASTEITLIWGPTGSDSGVENVANSSQKCSLFGDASVEGIITVKGSLAGYLAAKYCDELAYGGYNDWYLPSKSELAYVYCKAQPTGTHNPSYPYEDPNCVDYGGKESLIQGFGSGSVVYWSSTEFYMNAAWRQRFDTGIQDFNSKSTSNAVRCLRRVSPVFQASLPSPHDFTSNLTVTGLDFNLGGTPQSIAQTITIKNTGDGDANDLALAIDEGFEIESTTCIAILNRNQTCDVTIKASSGGRVEDGPYSGELRITAAGRSDSVNLQGTNDGFSIPVIDISEPSPSVFDTSTYAEWVVTYTGADTVNLKNTDIIFSGVDISGCMATVVDGTTLTPKVRVSSCTSDLNTQISFSIAANTAQNVDGNAAESNLSPGAWLHNFIDVGFEKTVDTVSKGSTVNTQNMKVVLSKAAAQDISVDYYINENVTTAVNPTNYNLSAGTVTIPAGALSADISYQYEGNNTAESSKIIQVQLRQSSTSGPAIALTKPIMRRLVVDPLAADGYTMVSAGNYHACGMTQNKKVKCWGSDNTGQLGNGALGDSNTPQLIDDATTDYSFISSGEFYTCGLTLDGTLKCWGDNFKGQLGDGTTNRSIVPKVIDAGVKYKAFSAGRWYACGITMTDVLKCWGYNDYGQLGDGTKTDSLLPKVIDPGVSYKAIASYMNHTCGITTGNILKCWGDNYRGPLGDGTQTAALLPKVSDVGTQYQAIAVGSSFTCGITLAQELKCWGGNYSGNLGDGSDTDSWTPKTIDSGVSYSQLELGRSHVCAITTTGQLKCWGTNEYGEVGNGDSATMIKSPAIIDSGVSYSNVSAGFQLSCGVTIDNVLKCWGRANAGQLGDGVGGSDFLTVDGGLTYKEINVSSYTSCGITSTGILKCWGDNRNGQVGEGSTNSIELPNVVDAGVTYTKVDVGGSHVCGITSSGVLKCWGANTKGQLGDGTTSASWLPKIIDSGTTYKDISAGGSFTCGITTGDVLKCWGYNGGANLGDGTGTDSLLPKVIDSGVSYSQVDVNSDGCALTTSGDLKCWGVNNMGELGSGSAPTPTIVAPGYSFTAFVMGSSHVCGITSTGGLKCWGSNTVGQLGQGGTDYDKHPSPLTVNSGTTYIDLGTNYLGSTCGITSSNVLKCWGSTVTTMDSGVLYKKVSASMTYKCGITLSGELRCQGDNTDGQLGSGQILGVPTIVGP